MLGYHHIKFITKKITVLKTCHRNKQYDAFIKLSNNKNIIIQKPDKGNTVVIIDQANYVKEMEKYCQILTNFLKLHLTLNIK